MLALFTVTVFVGSFLLFLVQPLIARQLLPVLGGTPAVWITCMMFFQAALLGGYVYAHALSRRLGRLTDAGRGRARLPHSSLVHLAVLGAPLLLLPPTVDAAWNPPVEGTPIWWLLGALTVMIGGPFFALSAGAPLLQRWFGATDHAHARDPYFLYAASNAGSMLALLAYPVAVEPLLTLDHQAIAWSAGYAVLVALTALCVVASARRRPAIGAPRDAASQSASPSSLPATPDPPPHEPPIVPLRIARWVLLAFIPSAWMLAVTSYITADLASVPLFWVIPLALYLLSFILVFARRRWLPHAWMKRAFPPAAIVLALLLATESVQPVAIVVVTHLAAFFIACMACHGELAADRPASTHLTLYYVMISAGGALGGVFNALLAPIVFDGVYEYPIIVVLGVAMVGAGVPRSARVLNRPKWKSVVRDALVALAVAAAVWALIVTADAASLPRGPARTWLIVGLPVIACYLFAARSLRFGLALGAVLTVTTFDVASHGGSIEHERSFFGVHTIHRATLQLDADEAWASRPFNELYHGTTLHGRQEIDPQTLAPVSPQRPRSYYSTVGPAGQVFRAVSESIPQPRVGIVGLGAGGLAAYAEAGGRFTFYEIDPVVKQLAEDTRYFTYLSEARTRGAAVEIVLGDARRTLGREPKGEFDLLVVDAFSSDAIPIHLITREAIELYLDRLKPEGVLLLHISSRYFDLEPVVERAARSLGLACLTREDLAIAPGGQQPKDASGAPGARTADRPSRHTPARLSSTWMAIARGADDLTFLRARRYGLPWAAPRAEPGRVWTDDYSHVLGVMEW